jgi:hypothetical protein
MNRFLVVSFLCCTAILSAQCTADKPEIKGRLLAAGILDPNRILTHCNHVCDIRFGGRTFPVVDLIELVKNASVPRGVQRIVILDPQWKKTVKTIPYITERPLFCRGNEIFVLGDLGLSDASGDPGNVLEFRGPDLLLRTKKVDINTLPSLQQQERQRKNRK